MSETEQKNGDTPKRYVRKRADVSSRSPKCNMPGFGCSTDRPHEHYCSDCGYAHTAATWKTRQPHLYHFQKFCVR